MKKNLNALKGEIRTIQKTYESVLKQVDKDISKAESKGWDYVKETHLTRTKPKLEILKQRGIFPRNPEDLERVDVAIKSKILKAELKHKFPNIPFEVRTSRYSGGSSIDVRWKDAVAFDKVNPIVKKYSKDFGSDSQTDYFHVDNYAFAEREITNWNERVAKLKSKLREKRLDLANADDYKVEQEAGYQLRKMDLPNTSIASLKKQIKEGLKGGTK